MGKKGDAKLVPGNTPAERKQQINAAEHADKGSKQLDCKALDALDRKTICAIPVLKRKKNQNESQ